jgi:hypothetical protein
MIFHDGSDTSQYRVRKNSIQINGIRFSKFVEVIAENVSLHLSESDLQKLNFRLTHSIGKIAKV